MIQGGAARLVATWNNVVLGIILLSLSCDPFHLVRAVYYHGGHFPSADQQVPHSRELQQSRCAVVGGSECFACDKCAGVDKEQI